MSSDTGQAKIKLTVAKLFEIAYSTNKGITTAFVRKKGQFILLIDDGGQVTLSGKIGRAHV